MRSDRAPLASVLLLVALAGVLPACARTIADESLVQRQEIRDDDLEFLAHLEDDVVVTNDDALHGLFLLQRGEDPYESYEQRTEEARRLGWIPLHGDPPPANQSATIGSVAVAIARISNLKGGLTMRLVGPTPRASTKELVFLGVLPDRTERQALTGPEFIELLGRADRLLLRDEPLDVEESIRRIEDQRTPDGLPENVRDLQQERQRDNNPR